jgi:nucleoside-diphosphate-sugar epimerase
MGLCPLFPERTNPSASRIPGLNLVLRTSDKTQLDTKDIYISKILFIGGTGNISAECAALLHQRGHEVSVVTRGRSSLPPQYRAIQADRKDPAAMSSALSGVPVDVVINFLGYDLADIEADFNLFHDAVAQYIFISSTTVYARPAPLPMTEDSPKGNPWWEYAQQKLACEQWLLERWAEARFPVTIVRPSHTYSQRWIPNPVSSSSFTFAARLEKGLPVFVPDDGENPWTLTAATDFAVGLAGLVGNKEAMGEAFHITSDEVLTWNQICAEIAAALGVASPNIVRVPVDFICEQAPEMTGTLKGDKAHPGIFDNTKIKRFVTEFQCRKPFRAGVRESVAWLRAHPGQQNLNPKVDELCDQVIGAWRKAATGS